MTEPWLTRAELARELRVSVSTIGRMRPPCLRVGGQNRYRLSEVERFLRGADVVSLPDRRRQQERGEAA